MPSASEREYYAERAARAAELAKAADDPDIAKIHEQLAANYRELALLAERESPLLKIVQEG